jgi:hypothetical protein
LPAPVNPYWVRTLARSDLGRTASSAATVIAGLVPAIQPSVCFGVCGRLDPGNECRDDSRVSSALVSVGNAVGDKSGIGGASFLVKFAPSRTG